MDFSSKLIEDAVKHFSGLPGVGKKTALRYVLHVLKQNPTEMQAFSKILLKLKEEINYCKTCHNVSDRESCDICTNPTRDNSIICVVEDLRDVIAIENTQQYKGLYHVLGGIISPMDGIGPNDLNIESLIARIKEGKAKELIMALSTTMEGDTTIFYLHKKLKDFQVAISTIARGIAIGDDLEYADEITLGRSIINRVPYENKSSVK